MLKLQSKMKALNTSAVATAEERAAIKLLVERAQKILPGTRVNFVQREQDGIGTLLVVSLLSPNFDDPENFELHAIAHDLDETSDLSLIVTQSSLPSEDKQLLKVRSFLSADEISADLKEPPHYSIFWRPEHQKVWGEGPLKKVILFSCIAVMVIYFLYVPLLRMAQANFPQIFGRELLGTKFERRIGFVRLTVDDAIQDIDAQIRKLTLTTEQVQELEADRALLEKAKRDLGTSEAKK